MRFFVLLMVFSIIERQENRESPNLEAAMTDHERAKVAKDIHTAAILDKPNVVGVGVGVKESFGESTGEICVKVLVREKIPLAGLDPQAVVPKDAGGVRTDVVQVGDLRALQLPTDRWRPAPGGVSIGHYKITAGTLGCVVKDRNSGARLILSNNHVLANSNDAVPGDPVLQPGPADGGTVDNDIIGRLERFCPIDFSSDSPACGVAKAYVDFGNALAGLVGSYHQVSAYRANPQAVNLVDAALARPDQDSDLLDRILEIGLVSGTTTASLGMAVRKSGRTTGFTTGEINVVDATVNVSYGTGKVATFEDQLVTSPMSQGGDSGSLVVAAGTPQAVGLLFAGSDQSTILNPIQAVLDCLSVDL
jgi:hypothetical protein